jgi:photosystem II stability/assembly factor-like uncharacterized protein
MKMKRKSIVCVILAVALISSILAGCSSSKLENNQPAAAGEDDQIAEGTLEGTLDAAEDPAGDAAADSSDASADDAGKDAAENSEGSSASEDTALQESSWTVVRDLQIDHPTNMTGFLNEQFGITGGPSGEIHYTNDGGQTWPQGENSSMCRFGLDIVDENLIWSGGNGNHVRVSKDGGKTWQAVTDIAMEAVHSNIDFVDDKIGWIATGKRLASTNDGGTTWTDMTLPEGAKSIAAICLRTPDEGYLLTLEGLLFKTTDGGSTWSSQDLEIKKYDIVNSMKKPILDKSNIALADISFADENNGIIVFTGLSSNTPGFKTWCLKTNDGGVNWTAEQLVLPDSFSAARVFCSGDCKYITLGSHSQRVLLLKSKE